MITDNDISFKFLDTKKLADILDKLPAGSVARVNAVGNLAIYKRDGDELSFIGFIDFIGEGEIEYS